MSQVLYSRSQDGARPVLVQPDGTYQLDGQQYTRKRDLLAVLTGHPTGRHWGVGRYFGLDRHAPQRGSTNVLELFTSDSVIVVPTLLHALAPTVQAITFDHRITAPAGPLRRGAGPLVVDAGPLGIDLKRSGHEVAKLLFAGFGRRIHASGYDPEDVLQQVYLGLVARNRGRCPWDPAKSSFGHYVHMVCGCVLANYHRKMRGTTEHEQLGMGGFEDDGEWGQVDVAGQATAALDEGLELRAAEQDMVQYLREEAPLLPKEMTLIEQALPLLVRGYTRKEAAAQLGVSAPTVSRAFALVRPYMAQWRHQR